MSTSPVIPAIYVISPDAVAQEIGTELIILDMASEQYISIDSVGAQMWSLLASGATMERVTESVAHQYGADPAIVANDLATFVGSLENLGLIHRVAA